MQLTKGSVGWRWRWVYCNSEKSTCKPLPGLPLCCRPTGAGCWWESLFLITSKDILKKYSPSWTLATSTALHVMAKNMISCQWLIGVWVMGWEVKYQLSTSSGWAGSEMMTEVLSTTWAVWLSWLAVVSWGMATFPKKHSLEPVHILPHPPGLLCASPFQSLLTQH